MKVTWFYVEIHFNQNKTLLFFSKNVFIWRTVVMVYFNLQWLCFNHRIWKRSPQFFVRTMFTCLLFNSQQQLPGTFAKSICNIPQVTDFEHSHLTPHTSHTCTHTHNKAIIYRWRGESRTELNRTEPPVIKAALAVGCIKRQQWHEKHTKN